MRRLLLACSLLAAGCGGPGASAPPNILLVVWDTVRADRISLYGHTIETTPHLERWASRGRIFDCTSASAWTVPAHASMFTGLLPGEHRVATVKSVLGAEHETLAERLRERGYQTWLFSANPFLTAASGLIQGFDVAEHSFDAQRRPLAQEILLAKLDPDDRSNDLRAALGAAPTPWALTSAGAIANERFLHFLDTRDRERPFFAALNYMEAHRIRTPARAARAEVMEADDVTASYRIDQRQARFQKATLGIAPPLSERERRVVSGVYDATLRELDALLNGLFEALAARDLLDETVVVLVSDHGEHLGDHDSYLHQYSLYEGLLRVPLVVWAPTLEPGREPTPVSNLDLFPTLLALAGASAPERLGAASLLEPPRNRPIVSEYLVPYAPLLRKFALRPDFDPGPFGRQIRAIRVGSHKALRRSDGTTELYDLATDPGETNDLSAREPARLAALLRSLERIVGAERAAGNAGKRPLSAEERGRLEALGYVTEDAP